MTMTPSQAVNFLHKYLGQVQYLLQVTSSYKPRYTPVPTRASAFKWKFQHSQKKKIHTIKRDTIVLL